MSRHFGDGWRQCDDYLKSHADRENVSPLDEKLGDLGRELIPFIVANRGNLYHLITGASRAYQHAVITTSDKDRKSIIAEKDGDLFAEFRPKKTKPAVNAYIDVIMSTDEEERKYMLKGKDREAL